nr:GspH/FimT family protein [Methylomarinum sp. Ch1-1]MDP4522742.1 GspH/FimT family protein [Methylomarinum sp. Ch1-1]
MEGAAEKLYADLQFAKSEAIKRNTDVYVTFNSTDQCYGIALASGCQCQGGSPLCELDSGVSKVVNMSEFGNTTMSNITFSGDETRFDPRRGTAFPLGRVEFQSPSGKEAHIRVSTLRVKLCSPSDTDKKIIAYEDCP